MSNTELIKQVQKGDKDAYNKLFEKNESLIHYVVNKYKKYKDDHYNDIVSSAKLGFVKAVNNFNTELGYKFSTFAVRCIRNEILIYLRKQNKENENKNPINLDCSVKTVNIGETVNLIDTISSEESTPLEQIELKEKMTFLNECIRQLPELERLCFIKYFLEEINQSEIGRELGCTRSYVNKLVTNARERIKKEFKKVGLSYEH